MEQDTQTKQKRVAIIGGRRIPFCRSVGKYASLANRQLLTGALKALKEAYSLDQVEVGEVVAGAVLKRNKDFSLARESSIDAGIGYETPGMDIQKACATSLEAAALISQKIMNGQIDVGIAAGTDTSSDVPIELSKELSQKLVQLTKERSLAGKAQTLLGLGPKDLIPKLPGVKEPRTGLSMGEHCELMAQEWKIPREEQDKIALDSHLKAASAYEAGFYNDLVVPFNGAEKDDNVRPDTTIEKMAKLKPVFERSEKGTLTAANSSPLTDGAAAVLMASEEKAKELGWKPQAYLTHYYSTGVDYMEKEGLLMAPAYAVPKMLQKAGLKLQDFDMYEIHEAFAAQVLCTLKAWESEDFCKNKLGLDAPLGSIDMSKLNTKGGSIAVGHPFGATGARILATAAKALEERGGGRCLISICAAGGLGSVAILER